MKQVYILFLLLEGKKSLTELMTFDVHTMIKYEELNKTYSTILFRFFLLLSNIFPFKFNITDFFSVAFDF